MTKLDGMISLRIDEKTVEKLDRVAERLGLTRSKVIQVILSEQANLMDKMTSSGMILNFMKGDGLIKMIQNVINQDEKIKA